MRSVAPLTFERPCLMPLSARLRRGGALLFAATFASLGVGTAADAAPIGVKIASPSADTLVKTTTVPVRLQVRPNVTSITVWDGTRDVTKRFRHRGRTYAAQLPLKPGAHKLLVQAMAGGKSAGSEKVEFAVARDVNSLLTAKSGASAVIPQGPAQTKSYRPTPGQVPVAVRTNTAAVATLKVNGHKVEDLRAGQKRTEHSWLVSIRDGLKAGRNVFVAEAYDAKGRHQVKRWIVRRDAGLPLAEAGPRERTVAPRRAVTLDGTGSRATQRGAKLTYAWRVVSAPKGAKPQLRNANSATPTFTPGKAGVYQVALRATQAKPGAHAAAVAGASEDVVTLSATPQPVSTQGLYIDTGIFGADPANKSTAPFTTMYVNGTGYSYPVGDGFQNFVQLDQTTLAPVAQGTAAQVKPAAGTFTIGQWQNSPVSYSGDPWGSIVFVGTQQVALNATPNGPGTNAGNPTSNLHGFIQEAGGINTATWVGSDMLNVKTRATTDTASTNTMEISGTQYPQTLPSGAVGGYHLMVLGNVGEVIWNKVYGMTGTAATDSATEDQVAHDIQQWPGANGTTTLLQGFGTLTALPTTGNLGNVIQTIGGRADVVSRFNAKMDATGGVYALIAGNASTSLQTGWSAGYRAEEASFERTGANSSLTALLFRDPSTNNFIPFVADADSPDAVGTDRNSMLPMIYGAPTNWTNTMLRNADGSQSAATAAEQAAYDDIAQAASTNGWVSNACPNQPDKIRAYYCTTDATMIANLGTNLRELTYQANSNYTVDDFNAVIKSLGYEITLVSNVRAGIADFQTMFGNTKDAGTIDSAGISARIQSAIEKATATTETNELAVASAITDMMSVIPGVGPAFTFMSGALSLDGALMPDSNPGPALEAAVQTSQATAASDIATAYRNASTHLSRMGDYIVQDPNKLFAGEQFFVSTETPTTDSSSTFSTLGAFALQRYLWGTMLAPAYSTWVNQGLWGASPWCRSSDGDTIGHPFENIDQPTGSWVSGIGTGGNHSDWVWSLGLDLKGGTNVWGWQNEDKSTGYLKDSGMPPSLTQQLFGAIDPTKAPTAQSNAGAVMPYFALDYLPVKFVPAIPYPNYNNGDNPVGNGCMKG
jgi:hypothetical protein